MRTKTWIRQTVWIALVCMGIFIAAEVEAQRQGGGRSGGGGDQQRDEDTRQSQELGHLRSENEKAA